MGYQQSQTVRYVCRCLRLNANIDIAIAGLGAAYNMAPDLALVLAVAAVALIGDPVAQTWSIGGSYYPVLPLTSAAGIIGAHNKLEGDASFGRVCLLDSKRYHC
jgi:hypothetical protein